MKRFRNILVCVNPKNQVHPALDRATRLAKHNDAVLKVVCTHEDPPTWARVLLPSKAQDWEALVLQEAEERLHELTAPIRDAGLTVTTRVLVGQAFIEIIREAMADAHDLLLKDLEPLQTGGNPFIGSTDMHLLRKCPCPVWLLRPSAAPRFERILAAVDPVPGDDEVRNPLNTKILELATSLAIQERCKLFVVRAYDSIAETFQATGIDSRDYSEYMERIQMIRLKNDREFIGKFEKQMGELDVRYVYGNPGTVISETARDENVDLVIMGTVERTGIPGFLIGRTAETVFNQVECSVLGVKPRGFESPI